MSTKKRNVNAKNEPPEKERHYWSNRLQHSYTSLTGFKELEFKPTMTTYFYFSFFCSFCCVSFRLNLIFSLCVDVHTCPHTNLSSVCGPAEQREI